MTVLSASQSLGFAISIDATEQLCLNPVAGRALADTADLLRRSFSRSRIGHNMDRCTVRIVLPDVVASRDHYVPGPSKRPYLCTAVPDVSYGWHSSRKNNTITVRLKASTPEGVAAGLYGLIQEKLGCKFYHPRASIVPSYTEWPLPGQFTFSGQPRFEKRGFHLHTLHPIELTEQLHDPSRAESFADIKAYLDWLARNGQNTFQFFLLRNMDRESWPTHARRIVEYAHQRGIRCGIEISLSMIQQQAFQAITVLRPYPSYQQQVDDTLAWLFQAPWDYLSLDVTMGEHLPFLDKLLPDVQMHIEQQVEKRYGARLMYATHVIAAREGAKVRRPKLPGSGIMIHSVMCYSATEAKAPVYGNRNQRFMFEAAAMESQRRETWYWPESSYWVGFDSSVPLLLLPYLDARLSDIESMSHLGVSGHLTFTSGWEWGYWLIDWSIARWSWSLQDNGSERQTSPLSRLDDLTDDQELRRLFKQALSVQNSFLKERELLRYLSVLTPFSELPPPFNKPFQPEPNFRYGWLLDTASRAEATQAVSSPIENLEAYASKMTAITDKLSTRLSRLRSTNVNNRESDRLQGELLRGLEVTSLRATHRALTLRALLAKKREQNTNGSGVREANEFLTQARVVRQRGQLLVDSQEQMYRYDPSTIARPIQSRTAYPFGYLYPASRLYFWEREEEQVRHGRFDAFFMNLWDMERTLGLKSLLFK